MNTCKIVVDFTNFINDFPLCFYLKQINKTCKYFDDKRFKIQSQ